MGKGMADNLVSKGHSLVVYDVNAKAVSDLGMMIPTFWKENHHIFIILS